MAQHFNLKVLLFCILVALTVLTATLVAVPVVLLAPSNKLIQISGRNGILQHGIPGSGAHAIRRDPHPPSQSTTNNQRQDSHSSPPMPLRHLPQERKSAHEKRFAQEAKNFASKYLCMGSCIAKQIYPDESDRFSTFPPPREQSRNAAPGSSRNTGSSLYNSGKAGSRSSQRAALRINALANTSANPSQNAGSRLSTSGKAGSKSSQRVGFRYDAFANAGVDLSQNAGSRLSTPGQAGSRTSQRAGGRASNTVARPLVIGRPQPPSTPNDSKGKSVQLSAMVKGKGKAPVQEEHSPSSSSGSSPEHPLLSGHAGASGSKPHNG
ncbi:unnamed protein product [Sympodiomycopsis kandeliae]